MDIHEDTGTYVENTWCKGCGNFGIEQAMKKTIIKLEEEGIDRRYLAISAGIGCHGKIFDYLRLHGLYSLHGRATPTVEGIKLGNPELKVIAFHGDGDAFGEGIAHTIFAAKRNFDMTMIVHDNGRYALTTGQFTPTTKKDVKTPSSPKGNPEDPMNPLALMLEAKATFIAQVYPAKITHMVDMMVKAIKHPGFAFIRVLQPCVTYNDTWKFYGKRVEIIEDNQDDINRARELVKPKEDSIPLGVLYQDTKKPAFHKLIYGDYNPVKDSSSRGKRIRAIKDLLNL